MTFDRLVYIDRLKQAGVEEPVARAHAEALRDALLKTVATKADLKEAFGELGAAIANLDKKVGTDIARLDHKIEVAARDLIIKGAGGLVVIAGLIIGLKLFG